MPRRKRSTEAEVAARVEEVLHCRLNGAEFHDLQALAREKDWNVGDRQLWRYVEAADKLIEEWFEKDRGKLFRRHVFQRRALYARALQDGDYRTGLAILKDEAAFHGLYPAQKLEMTGKDGGALVVRFEDLSDEDLLRIASTGGAGAAEAPGSTPEA
jgi:hypothetical protein